MRIPGMLPVQQKGVLSLRTFRNPYTEQAYRRSVTGLDEEILHWRIALVHNWESNRSKSARKYALDRLLELHRKRNKLMEVKTNAEEE
jgi:hypothetical protein